ncbi:indole-3-glycerol phosphate synthase TrpC [Hazenella sp. IB182357]|uniref:Indole-3-glycerol phosphate synthase n=1 Tax=Polycladospora coralii TaxID=2771432 RepID=A0A926NDT5_9BACL|nr:indole-3-glycerol phosphate synthase TrpC [Polycladospora coralii]MBD1371613.1 indole-3-glycerol phosphate synthase TrpC [Polycladospora coralii]MBS7529080.1 indole-3-glycerol phosphate synthase TrpC [Polycladospora coralii]
MFLKQIVAYKQNEIKHLEQTITPEIKEKTLLLPAGRPFAEALQKDHLTLIAEVKPASPSRGVIKDQVDPVQTARMYEEGGAQCISVLTEQNWFKGKPEYLTAVKQQTSIPILRKDFIVDPLQVIESKRLGADAILLIVSLLTPQTLHDLITLAHQLRMEVLVEVHSLEEVEVANESKADVLGINNRDLQLLTTDLGHTERIFPFLNSDRPILAESGIHSIKDAIRMRRAGVDGVLVGEFLMRQSSPTATVAEIVQVK